MRKTIAEILSTNKIDLKKEYEKLWDIFYKKERNDPWEESKSFYELIDDEFYCFPSRKTCITLKEFDEYYGFNFKEYHDVFDIDYFVSFLEYLYNLAIFANGNYRINTKFNTIFVLQQIKNIIESIGYRETVKDNLIILVPNSAQANYVAEITNDDISNKILEYNHYSLKGNLEAKKAILLSISNAIEPKRKKLKGIDQNLEKDIFFGFNNFNVRHNNGDHEDNKNYHKTVSNLSNEEKESIYDYIYELCLIAFIKLDNIEKAKIFENNKKEIENKV